MKLVWLMFKNIRRNPLRTILTGLGTAVLVFVVTLVWSVLSFLDAATREKAANFKAIVTERWQLPSQMPFTYAAGLERGGARMEGDVLPVDSMTWQFYGGTLDKRDRRPEAIVFFIGLAPRSVLSMLDELDQLEGARRQELAAAVRKMEENRKGVIIGRDRLKALNKRIGDRFIVSSINYRDIDLEVEVVGTFPEGTRYDNSAVMNRDYLLAALDAYPRKNNGRQHPLRNKTLNLVWLKVPDKQQFERLASQIVDNPDFSFPAVKVETASSGIASFLDAYRDLIWGTRYLLAPAILATLSLVMSNSISISVRERRMEIAVLKVLGFRPYQIMLLVLGEALIIGLFFSLITVTATYYFINEVNGGLKVPVAFFSAFFVPASAFIWAVAVGGGTALIGSIIPALSARNVKVADVFAKVA
jgi:putative ABC transport system permease protein